MQFGPGFLPTFFYYFATTSLLLALATSKGLGLGFSTGYPQQIGVLGGLIAGILGGALNRTITLTVPFNDQKAFIARLNDIMTRKGYERQEDMDEVWVYQRANLAKLLTGKVFVFFGEGNATIASRAVQIRGIREVLENGD
jgi:hypothetical protein